MSSFGSAAKILFIFALMLIAGNNPAIAQSVSHLSGIVVDQNGDLIPGVEITILSLNGMLERTVTTDSEGFFSLPFLPSDEYSLKVSKDGFDPAEIPDLVLSEGAERQLKIELKINPLSEAIKVQSEPAKVEETQTEGARFNRPWIENLPLNGRSPQAFVDLVPGVVRTPVDSRNLGQFSSNGQRTNANYFTVDGVSANFGTTNYDFLGQTGGGSIPATNVQGGLDNLVAAEALEEVRIATLDFAPASARTPGAGVALFSRAGANDFSLSFFANYRNDRFNARDFFDLEKPPHDLNGFGASAGGPLFLPNQTKNSNFRTYFFLSFEEKSFTLPQPTVVTEVPSLEIRQETSNAVAQAIYNSFPLPNEKEKPEEKSLLPNGALVIDDASLVLFPKTEKFRATYADPNRAENYNLRLDHIFNSKFSLFARFNQSPSFSENRNPANLSSFIESSQLTRTLTLGSTQAFSGGVANDFRFNTSRQESRTVHDFDGRYGGVLPDQSLFIPTVFDAAKTHFRYTLNGFPDSLVFFYGNYAENETRQLALVDNLSFAFGNHALKFGFEYRRLSPTLRASGYGINYDFDSSEAIALGTANRVSFYKNPNVDRQVVSVSSFAQDNWQVNSRLNLVYGLRWEINPAPSAKDKTLFTLERAPDLAEFDQTKLKLAPAGTPYFQTGLRNFAPRLGAAVQIFNRRDQSLVLRGGFGTFYDLGQSQFNELASPFDHSNGFAENLTLPVNGFLLDFLTGSGSSSLNKRLVVISAAPDYRLPRTFFWSLGAQLKLGAGEMFSLAYVGGAGRFLQRTLTLNLARPGETDGGYFSDKFSKVIYIDNAHSSDYHALQFQYSRALANGFQSFANYTWSHSLDTASSDNNIATPFFNYAVSNDRGDSDFDARHALSVGFSYDLPPLESRHWAAKLLNNWTFGGIFAARTGLPYDVKIAEFNPLANEYETRRADVRADVPLFVAAPESPTGKRLNIEAFSKPAQQGSLGRNALTGPFMWQFDASVGKQVRLAPRLRLQFRAEVYNVFNHPNFSNPQARILYRSGEKIIPENFGFPSQTMARGYAASEPTGGVNPVFQTGGARALQFSLRLKF